MEALADIHNRALAMIPADEADRIGRIYESEAGRLRALGAMLMGGPSAGDDLAQDTFAEALRLAVHEPGHLREPAWAWLRTIAVRLAIKRRRRAAAELHHLMSLGHEPAVAQWTSDTGELVAALRHLPPRVRACLSLKYVDDLSNAAIAETLGCSLKTVENQLRNGRQRLRELVEADAGSGHIIPCTEKRNDNN